MNGKQLLLLLSNCSVKDLTYQLKLFSFSFLCFPSWRKKKLCGIWRVPLVMMLNSLNSRSTNFLLSFSCCGLTFFSSCKSAAPCSPLLLFCLTDHHHHHHNHFACRRQQKLASELNWCFVCRQANRIDSTALFPLHRWLRRWTQLFFCRTFTTFFPLTTTIISIINMSINPSTVRYICKCILIDVFAWHSALSLCVPAVHSLMQCHCRCCC